ncbi:MAG: hypothetical protein V8S72_09345 [Oscillospiraceae bacterium]
MARTCCQRAGELRPYLAKGKDNEVDRSNDALFRAQKNADSIVQDTDAMSVDHEYRLTLLELGLSE